MLSPLFRNPSIERILLFLFINKKCYGSQIQTALNVPLIPIQKELDRLEQGGILESYFVGNRRIFSLNSHSPLKEELEITLKKRYLLLPSEEKLKFSQTPKRKKDLKTLLKFWKQIGKTTHLKFSAKTKEEERTILRRGIAGVDVKFPSKSTIIFLEKGAWIIDEIPSTSFSNQFRWTLQLEKNRISLEHLRYGENNPVLLFQLKPSGENTLNPCESFLCDPDTYMGSMNFSKSSFSLHIRVLGPKKNQELLYEYF